MLAVDFDEPQQTVFDYAKELGLNFNLLLDPGGEIQNLYRIRAYPSSFFVSSDGTIAGVHLGVTEWRPVLNELGQYEHSTL